MDNPTIYPPQRPRYDGAMPPEPRHRPPAVPPHEINSERSLGDLFRELALETKVLVRQEVALVKAEVSQKSREVGQHIGKAAAGGFVAYAGFIVALMGVGVLLGTVMPDWLGLTIVGVIALLVGFTILKSGMKALKQTNLSLDHTAQSIREDVTFVKHEARDVARDPQHLGSSNAVNS